jgi:hypothetical protein
VVSPIKTASPKASPVTPPVTAPVERVETLPPPQPDAGLDIQRMQQQAEVQRLQQQVRQTLNQAAGLFDTAQYAEAVRLIDDALKLDPKNGEALALRQKALAAQAFEGRLQR